MENPPTRAVILAAGRGRRLIPYTNHAPKPLLPVEGRPLLDYTLEALAVAGVEDVCIVLGYLGEQIADYVGNGSDWSLRVIFRWQLHQRGTADALITAQDFLIEPSFVTAADYALRRNYLAALKAAYLRAGLPLAVSLKQLAPDKLSERSSVAFDAEGQVRRIVEKPAPGSAPSHIAASLIYIIPPEIQGYLNDLQLSPRQEYEIVDVINRMLDDGYAMKGLVQAAPREWQP